MPQIKRIAPGSPPSPDPAAAVEAADAELVAAQEAHDTLVAERREKRASLSREEWRKYNADTADDQMTVQSRLDTAVRDAGLAHRRARRLVPVGAASEKSTAGGAKKGGAS